MVPPKRSNLDAAEQIKSDGGELQSEIRGNEIRIKEAITQAKIVLLLAHSAIPYGLFYLKTSYTCFKTV